MWVRFLRNFDWDPPERKGRVTLFFEAGKTHLVRKLCALAAIERGAAVRVERPR